MPMTGVLSLNLKGAGHLNRLSPVNEIWPQELQDRLVLTICTLEGDYTL